MMIASRVSAIGRRSAFSCALRPSASEHAASLLLALLLVTGAVAFGLLLVWLGMHALFPLFTSVPITVVQMEGGGKLGDIGGDLLLDSATAEDVAGESDLTDLEFESTLKMVVDAAALERADLADSTSLNDGATGVSKPGGTSVAAGQGNGGGKAGIPPHLRWEIDFGTADTLDTYARKLDFFGIELGILGAPERGKVTYIRNLARPLPDVRVGLAKEDKRLYMSWRGGTLKNADRGLAAKAGLPAANIILQFFSEETEQLLLRSEYDFCGRDASTIRKTRFGLRPVGKRYEFYVIEQHYL